MKPIFSFSGKVKHFRSFEVEIHITQTQVLCLIVFKAKQYFVLVI